jgi:hypothetical protein
MIPACTPCASTGDRHDLEVMRRTCDSRKIAFASSKIMTVPGAHTAAETTAGPPDQPIADAEGEERHKAAARRARHMVDDAVGQVCRTVSKNLNPFLHLMSVLKGGLVVPVASVVNHRVPPRTTEEHAQRWLALRWSLSDHRLGGHIKCEGLGGSTSATERWFGGQNAHRWRSRWLRAHSVGGLGGSRACSAVAHLEHALPLGGPRWHSGGSVAHRVAFGGSVGTRCHSVVRWFGGSVARWLGGSVGK